MFAFVFWHLPKADAVQSDYENGLTAFANGLMSSGCEGLRSAHSFRISAVPWLDGQDGYEDWAIIDHIGVLERLNEVAVTGAMEPLHTRVARPMEIGHGGIHEHVWGDLEPSQADRAQWLVRPRGIDYRPVLERIAESAGQPVSVWRRFMVLGPGREFLILGRDPLELEIPEGWSAHPVSRRLLG